jgi:peroxiredoxin
MPAASTMTPLGSGVPDFALPDVTTGRTVALRDLADARALLVMFLCRHCPYVKHVRDGLARLSRDYEGTDVAIVAISANDPDEYPEDAPESLAEDARAAGYRFPFLFDQTQAVARAFGAACTPDFFLYDVDRRLVYRGQLDDSRPGNGIPVTGRDLRAAIEAVRAGDPVSEAQRPSIGCSIKWRAGGGAETGLIWPTRT